MRNRRVRVVFGVAAATAALQIALATRWEGRAPHVAALALGWAGALWLRFLRGAPAPPSGTAPLERAAGAFAWATTCAVSIAARHDYFIIHRFLPVIAGLTLVVTSCGLRRLRDFRSELLLLCLTVLYPLPFALQQALMPTPLTAAAALAMVRLLGVPGTRSGTLLELPGSSLRVFDACSGMVLMTQLLMLAVVLLCFFPTTARRGAVVVIAAIISGFVVNAARVAYLARVAAQNPSQFVYIEQYVAGSAIFPLIATGLAGIAWWLVFPRADVDAARAR